MAEVNEAYDMLMNPEKYSKYQQQTQSNSGYGQGGYSQGYGQAFGGYHNPDGWSGDFGGFDFGDIFGFGFGVEHEIPEPQVMRKQMRLMVSALGKNPRLLLCDESTGMRANAAISGTRNPTGTASGR